MAFHLCTDGVRKAAKSFGLVGRRAPPPAGRQYSESGISPALSLFGLGGLYGTQGSLPEMLQRFREEGSRQLGSAGRPPNAPADVHGTTPWEPLWDAACNVVEALLLGVESHVPGTVENVAMASGTASLRVRLRNGPCHGEFATRSRLSLSVCLEQELRIEMRAPVNPEDPVVLNITGLTFMPLSEITSLRRRLKKEMGADFTKESAYEWWDKNRYTACPLESSKLHRCWESLFGLRVVQLAAGLEQRQDAFWNYLHSSGVDVQSFEFRYDECHEVRMTGTRRPLPPNEHGDRRRLLDTCDELCCSSLRRHGRNMQRFAPSGYNLLSLFYGLEVVGAGACPKKIAKLLSAASSWGPGEDGWQHWDRTWRCVDEQDWLMRVVREQGRVIWQARDEATDACIPSRGYAELPSACNAGVERYNDEGDQCQPGTLGNEVEAGEEAVLDPCEQIWQLYERTELWPLAVLDVVSSFVSTVRSNTLS